MSVQTILAQAGGRGPLDLNQMCLVLESFEGGLDSNSPTSTELLYTGGLLLLQHCPPARLDVQMDIEQRAFEAGLKIIRRMHFDHEEGRLHRFELSSVTFDSVGPLFDSAYGYRFGFSFLFHLNLDHNPADWL